MLRALPSLQAVRCRFACVDRPLAESERRCSHRFRRGKRCDAIGRGRPGQSVTRIGVGGPGNADSRQSRSGSFGRGGQGKKSLDVFVRRVPAEGGWGYGITDESDCHFLIFLTSNRTIGSHEEACHTYRMAGLIRVVIWC